MSDLIDRRQAIDAVDAIGHIATMPDGDKCIRRSAVKYTLSMLPSAQPEPYEDAVPRTSVEYICRKNTVSTNPYEHKYHDKFIQFMDDPEISDFGRWQHSNGFNTALVAVKCDLDKVPSAQTDIIQCRNCKFASGDSRICMKFGHSPIGELDFCSWAERKEI